MCGRFNVIDDPLTMELLDDLGVEIGPASLPILNTEPTSTVPIVTGSRDMRRIEFAVWWLLLEETVEGVRPNQKWRTFNAVAKRLPESPLYRRPFQCTRCIIPASGYYEWKTEGGRKTPYYIKPVNRAIAFAGLFKRWNYHDVTTYSCSLITTAAHSKLEHIHDRSLPVMLAPGDYDRWLDPHDSNIDQFQKLFEPRLTVDFTATPVNKYVNNARNKDLRCMEAVGEPELIPAD